MLERMGRGNPVRLMVGGLHGREGRVTEPVLQRLSKTVKTGTLVLCNLSRQGKYISTLRPAYYQTSVGQQLLSLLREYQPEFYIELHSYKTKHYKKLTDPARREKVGVPPMIPLEHGILLGSVSPLIRTSEVKKRAVCLTLDIPEEVKDAHIVIELLNMVIATPNKVLFLEQLRNTYPAQIQMAEQYFQEYYKDVEPF